jgi:hypothetical protein
MISCSLSLILLQFQQTLKTFLTDRVWNFHFYVTKDWPHEPVALHFPGVTHTVSTNYKDGFWMGFQSKYRVQKYFLVLHYI